MSSKNPNYVQQKFIDELIKRKIGVTIYLQNGFQLKGVIKCADMYSLVLTYNAKDKLVYKQAITTIEPSRKLENLEK